ncbi:MAG TPA: DcaP family trimeric outer membrane transporter [Elusimicrobiales bacterium]|nr:DcaP family trimeric outer membrane transporter [Elusimicrobiales bacterium]
MRGSSAIAVLSAVLFVQAPAFGAQEPAASGYKFSFYGHIRTDAIYDVHGMAGDDTAQYVLSKKDSDRDLRISARGTRLGLDITDNARVSGKLETDFAGVTDGASTTDLRLRHAYMTVKVGKSLEILTGQTWQLMPPEFSGTVNEFALGYSGVLWSRVPQFRATYRLNDRYTAAAAVARPTRKLTDSEGTASGLPQGQAQVQARFGKSRFTLAGAMGTWRNAGVGKARIRVIDLGYNVPLSQALTLNGQIWTGQNLYDFLGGIGQNGYGSDKVKASGGFANLLFRPAGKYFFNAAYGVDDPVSSRLPVGGRTRNSTMLANVNTTYGRAALTLEIARQVTQYKTAASHENMNNMHYQFSCKFPF